MNIGKSASQIVDKLSHNLPQSVLLSAPKGIALDDIVRQIVPEKPIFIRPDESRATPIIPTEVIRDLYYITKSHYSSRRIIVIDRADTMNPSAQAAFLKLLEEPGKNVYFILLTSRPNRLLPTIRSRVQIFNIEPMSEAESRDFIASKGVNDSRKVEQLMYLASGMSEELEKLIDDPKYFEEVAAVVKDAQSIVSGGGYEGLMIAHKYKDNRTGAVRLTELAIAMVRKLISSKPDTALVDRLEQLVAAHDRILANGNIRLVLAKLMV